MRVLLGPAGASKQVQRVRGDGATAWGFVVSVRGGPQELAASLRCFKVRCDAMRRGGVGSAQRL
jgi:hypothetical protein